VHCLYSCNLDDSDSRSCKNPQRCTAGLFTIVALDGFGTSEMGVKQIRTRTSTSTHRWCYTDCLSAGLAQPSRVIKCSRQVYTSPSKSMTTNQQRLTAVAALASSEARRFSYNLHSVTMVDGEQSH
jgi:phage-related protein